MSNIIKYLPENIINRIAAGEIIERPSSVIKELLENSLDAEAKIIEIFLINSGKTLIKVSDNGKGMNRNDACICFKKHTTSKIEVIEDLFKIYTKGFRGEALSSISSISQLEIITKDNTSEIGVHLIINKNFIKKEIPIQINIGTNILVKNIFFNIPVRRNLLKSNQIELDFIIYELSKLALAHFDVNFKLYNNNNLILNLKSSSLKERIINIFSEKINEELIYFSDKKNINLKLKGFFSKPFYSKKNKNEQFLFVNNRFFYNKYLHKKILKYYKDYLKIGHYPSYFIFIYLDPKNFDINVDPQKKTIHFYNESIIDDILKKNIKIILGKYRVVTPYFFEKKTFFNDIFSQDEIINNNLLNNNGKLTINKKEVFNKIKFSLKKNNHINNEIFKYDNNIYFKIQIYKKYILTVFNNELIIIDQHRAHQRIIYDKLLITYKKKLLINNLLIPINISLSIKECEFLKSLNNDFKNIGLIIDYYSNYIRIKTIPNYLNYKNLLEFINEILIYKNLKKEIKYFYNILIRSIAKYNAIKGGILLNNNEINLLINKLFLCKNFRYSPYNKIIYIILDKNYFINKFNKK